MLEVADITLTLSIFINKFVYRRSWKSNMNNIKLYFKDPI